MLPIAHLLIGLVFSGVFYFVFPVSLVEVFVIFLANFFIDFDHYLYYLFKEKDFSVRRAIHWFKMKSGEFRKLSKVERRKHKHVFCCFHGLEWVLLFVLLGYYFWSIFYFVAIGMSLHLICDFVWGLVWNSVREVSLIWKLVNW